MKKTIYVAFKIDANSYEEANKKLLNSFKAIDKVLSDTILIDFSDQEIRNIMNSNKIVTNNKI